MNYNGFAINVLVSLMLFIAGAVIGAFLCAVAYGFGVPFMVQRAAVMVFACGLLASCVGVAGSAVIVSKGDGEAKEVGYQIIALALWSTLGGVGLWLPFEGGK